MKDNLGVLGLIAFYVYLIASQVCTLYFWYIWSHSHGFISTVLIGPLVSEFKGLLFPFFI